MATLKDLKKIISKYHRKNKEILRQNVNAMWQEVFKMFRKVETGGEVEKKKQPNEHLNRKHCKYCNKWVNLEDYNLADEICLKCYKDNVEDEGEETGNE